MQFNNHHKLSGLHAPFSASSSHWLRYDDDKVLETFTNLKAKELGTRMHEWAAETIKLGIKQPKSNKTIYKYVNDAIGYKMEPEVVLFYSERFFGTADAISFRKNVLRIHDLKTGKTPVKMEQLMVYAALFCLEYRYKPSEIDIVLQIYQNDEVLYHEPTVDEITHIMDRIVHLDKLLAKMEEEV